VRRGRWIAKIFQGSAVDRTYSHIDENDSRRAVACEGFDMRSRFVHLRGTGRPTEAEAVSHPKSDITSEFFVLAGAEDLSILIETGTQNMR